MKATEPVGKQYVFLSLPTDPVGFLFHATGFKLSYPKFTIRRNNYHHHKNICEKSIFSNILRNACMSPFDRKEQKIVSKTNLKV